jgi:hypothetical protein
LISQSYQVLGSTTTQEKLPVLDKAGIQPFLIELNPNCKSQQFQDFLKCEVLIINIPPSLRKKPSGFHLAQIEEINNHILKSEVKKVIYISSTSVYPEINQKINEDFIINEPLPEIFKAENSLKMNSNIDVTILRCGGLMGYDRIPAKYFAGRKDIPQGDKPVNYIHRDDVIEVIYQIIKKNIWGELLNLVAPIHPTKMEVCEKTAEDFEMKRPEFSEERSSEYKIIEAERVVQILNYDFKYPNPLTFYYKL